MSNILDAYVMRYPQLSLPVEAGMSGDARYTDIVRRGRLPLHPVSPFRGSPRDEERRIETPVGVIPVLHIGNRGDFERFVNVLRDRCEPVPVPPSMGALTLLGVINWRKIQAHKRQWILDGHTEGWAEEQKRFVTDPARYRDTVVLVSDGPYSALPAEQAGMEPELWRERSLDIRIWHELTHVVCRKLWPGHKQAVRDEVLADCVGLLAAFGRYDPGLALALLGVTPEGYCPGGRLQNYLPEGLPSAPLLEAVRQTVQLLAVRCARSHESPFAMLTHLEEEALALPLFTAL